MIGLSARLASRTSTRPFARSKQGNHGPEVSHSTVGTVAYFMDTEGNVVGISQRETPA
jgi:hypothetical protein